jgi:hypothetical protein
MSAPILPDQARAVVASPRAILHEQGRIQSTKGNLLTSVTVPGVSASARKLGVPIRVFYTSNAEDMWELTPRYRDNLLGIPVDERSVFLRTVFPRNRRRDPQQLWKYVEHGALEAQRRLSRDGWSWTWYFDEDSHPSAPENMAVIGLPGRTERETPAQASLR